MGGEILKDVSTIAPYCYFIPGVIDKFNRLNLYLISKIITYNLLAKGEEQIENVKE